ncbi:uncharacterized protein LOC117788313 [Drosophila innubila]|uniref:uncharacterized protein LOC117788313 n=1 Tax=Drosophila innubila TaxID=198719 RepID=UPI00148DE6E8|nr:uncharacterized protein LOC117788313 [Drosophila innubila]
MAKIAVVFLLVAIVAVCNGARVVREEPAKFDFGVFQPIADGFAKVLSPENMAELKKNADELLSKASAEGQKLGDEALKKFTEAADKFKAEMNKAKADAPK